MEKSFEARAAEDRILAMAEARRDDDELLAPEDATKFRTAFGRVLSVSHASVDLQYCAKERARGMSKPTAGDMMMLRRAVRYTLAAKLTGQSLHPEPPPTSEFLPMAVPVDSD